MSTLHTINKSPGSNLLASCQNVIGDGDSILFIEDGVYHCSSPTPEMDSTLITYYSLREDMIARAVLAKSTAEVEAIDTSRFVELCCEHDKIVSWF